MHHFQPSDVYETGFKVDEPMGSSTLGDDLLVVGSVRRIIGGFNFREPLHAGGMDFGDPVLEPSALDGLPGLICTSD
jgi:hypothetical protein